MSIYKNSVDDETQGELTLELDAEQADRFERMRNSINQETSSDLNHEEFLNWVLEQADLFTFP